ncbi:protein NEDD1-like isoform X2 [Patiria miniata]|uniref:Protein NEDD1 n=1 Tax=Patiria miniata TaxID=46514 RepID=A0A914AUH7_PATMI|nr:protein NEDD1-like isoform X2 [Patiria miniata]
MEDGLKLATGGDDIKLWDVAASSAPLHQFCPHSSAISSISWSHNNQILASAGSSGDKVVLTFIKNAASNIIEIAEEEKQTCVAFNSTSRYLLTGGKNRIVSIWDLKSRKLKKTYTGHQDAVTYTTFNWNDTYIASGSASGEILLHNVVSGQASSPLLAPKAQSIRGLEYSLFKKSLLASVSDDGGLTMWDTNSRKAISTFRDAHRAPATALVFSPVNDMLLMSTGLDKRIVCYDVIGKSVIKSMTVESPLTSISCMHDGATLAVGSTRGKVYIFDLRTGSSPLKVLHGHKSSVQCVQFQNSPTTRSNGVSSKGSKPVQPVAGSRKLPQVTPGVAMVNPTVQRGSMTSTDMDAGKSLEETRGNTNRPTPREDIENQDIISPIREGTVSSVKYPESMDRLSRPDTMGKAEGTPAQSRDSLPDFFSPLSENASNISLRRNPIGSVELAPQPSLIAPQPITKGLPNDQNGANATSFNPVSPLRTSSLTSQPKTTSKPEFSLDLQTRQGTSPVRERSKSLTSPRTPLLGGDFPAGGALEFNLSPENESARSGSAGLSATAGLGSGRVPVNTGIHSMVEVDAKPIGTGVTPRRGGSPARGLLGGSSDAAPRVMNGNMGALSRVGPPVTIVDPREEGSRLASGGADLQPFQVQFIKNMIDDSLEEFKESFHREILHLQREMVRQFQIQQNEMHELLQKYSVNEGLLTELERLREENKNLKAKY